MRYGWNVRVSECWTWTRYWIKYLIKIILPIINISSFVIYSSIKITFYETQFFFVALALAQRLRFAIELRVNLIRIFYGSHLREFWSDRFWRGQTKNKWAIAIFSICGIWCVLLWVYVDSGINHRTMDAISSIFIHIHSFIESFHSFIYSFYRETANSTMPTLIIFIASTTKTKLNKTRVRARENDNKNSTWSSVQCLSVHLFSIRLFVVWVEKKTFSGAQCLYFVVLWDLHSFAISAILFIYLCVFGFLFGSVSLVFFCLLLRSCLLFVKFSMIPNFFFFFCGN